MIPPVSYPPVQPDPVAQRKAREAYTRVREAAEADQQAARNATGEPPKWPPHLGQKVDRYA
jgi:hypothetical protein